MSSRYDDKLPRINNSDSYQQIFEDRGVKFIEHYNTPALDHANYIQINQMAHVHHVWKLGDRFYKLANEHYGSAKLWWIIAWYNKIPTESHAKAGQVVRIPMPLDRVASILRIR